MTWNLLREQLLALASPAPDRLEVSPLALAAGAVVVGELERLGCRPPERGAGVATEGGIWIEWTAHPQAEIAIYADGAWEWWGGACSDDQIDSLIIHLGAAQ